MIDLGQHSAGMRAHPHYQNTLLLSAMPKNGSDWMRAVYLIDTDEGELGFVLILGLAINSLSLSI